MIIFRVILLTFAIIITIYFLDIQLILFVCVLRHVSNMFEMQLSKN